MKKQFLLIMAVVLASVGSVLAQCNVNASICTSGTAGPFNFGTKGTKVSTCLAWSGNKVGYIILNVATGGQLNLLVKSDKTSGYLDVALFKIPAGQDPCTAIQNNANQVGCNYASSASGCNQFGSGFSCASAVTAPNVNAGDQIMIVAEDFNSQLNNFTLEVAPGGATVGPPSGTVNAVTGTITTVSANFQMTAVNMGGTWTASCGSCITSTGLFKPSVAGIGSHTVNYSVGVSPCIGTGSTTVAVGAAPNTAPTINNQTFSIAENSANNTVVGTVVASDAQSDPLTYSITAGNTGGAFSINGTTGQLRVANSAILDYETLTSIALTIQVSDGSLSSSATVTVNITNVIEAPILTATGSVDFNSGGTEVVVAPTLTLTAESGVTFSTAKVSIGAGFVTTDQLIYTTVNGITGSYNSSTGILTLSGTATAAQYQAALRTVKYKNTTVTSSASTRNVNFAIGGSLYNEENGHFYEVINHGSNINWTVAKNNAATRSYYGLQGYLVTITSAAENTFVSQKISVNTWMGASDEHTEGVWRWVTGPEGLENGGLGRHFSNQFKTADCAANQAPGINGYFAAWAPGEPNDCSGNEDVAHFIGSSGQWNDFPHNGGVSVYIVEYGGMPGDPTIKVIDNVTVNVIPKLAPTLTTASFSLTAIDEDALGSAPVTVASIMDSLGASGKGMAVYGVSGSGQWQQSTDGSAWFGFDYNSPGAAALSATNAKLLAPGMYIRFVPNADWNGTASFSIRAWDQTSGTNLAFVNVSSNGGSTAFSSGTAQVGLPVNAVNDAPMVTMPNTSGVLNFGGASEYVELPSLDISGPNLTVEAWVYVDNRNKNWARIFDFGNGPATNNIIFGLESTSGRLFMEVYSNGTGLKVSAPSVVPTGQWVHLAAVWNGTTGTIYQNGVAVASGNQRPIGNQTRAYNYFGKSNWADEYFDGKMTDIRVWNTARSQADITGNMNKILAGNEAGLMMYYKASEAASTYLPDYGPLKKKGTFHGTNWIVVQVPSASVSTKQDSSLAIGPIQFSDIDAGSALVTATFSVSNGTLTVPSIGTVTGNGTAQVEVIATVAQMQSTFNSATNGLRFTPNIGFSGTDILEVAINDGGNTGSGGVLTSEASIYINVIPTPNTPPSIADAYFTINEDEELNVLLALHDNYLSYLIDADGDTAQIIKFTSLPSNGTLYATGIPVVVNQEYGRENIIYVPNAQYSGMDTFGFTLSDGQAYADAPALAFVNVLPVNDLPVLEDFVAITDEDVKFNPFASAPSTVFYDEEGALPVEIKIVSLPAHGTLVLGNTPLVAGATIAYADMAQFFYIPDQDYFGNDSFTWNATDGNSYAAADATINIVVQPVNDAPYAIALSMASVDENVPHGTVVGTLTSSDVELTDTHVYQLVSGAGDQDNVYFNIVGDQLVVSNNINFELTSQLSIRVQSLDSGGDSYEEVLIITVNDKNDAPTGLTLSNNTIEEQQTSGNFVGILMTQDEDVNDTHTLVLVSGAGDADNASFAIVNNVLVTNAILDYNTQSQYTIRVRTTDAEGAFIEEVFIINLLEANQAPVAIALSHAAIAENNLIGAFIGYFSSTDVDSNDTHIYTLVNGNGDDDNASFIIDNGDLKAAEAFDFETKSSYSIRVRSTDAGGLYTEAVFAITIIDGPDAPTAIALDANSIDENLPVNTLIGILNSIDPDQIGNHTYSLVGGIGADDNGSFSLVGAKLYSAASFNYEAKDSYSIRVRSTDNDGGYTEEVFVININDVNDAPSDVIVSFIGIDENEPIGTAVGYISAIDEDAMDVHTFTFVNGFGANDNAKFSILANKLQTNAHMNYEQQSHFTVRIRATDIAGASVEKHFTFSINDVNEAPTAITLSATSINENEPAGAVIGTFSTTDEDNADSHTYDFVAGQGDDDNAAFHISGNLLIANASFNFEVKSSYTIRVSSTDLAGLQYEEVFIISIIDQIDAPQISGLSKVIFKNAPQPFNKREFTAAYSQDEGRALKQIRIIALPAHGQLVFLNTPVVAGQTFLVSELTSLSYTPAYNYVGADVFTFAAFDGVTYSADASYTLSVVQFRQVGGAASTLHGSGSVMTLNPGVNLHKETGSESTVGIGEVPFEVAAFGNYPNPFQGNTSITFELPASMSVTLEVYDVLGRKVETLVDGEELSGKQTIVWNGKETGQYICRLIATASNGEVITKTLNLLQVK